MLHEILRDFPGSQDGTKTEQFKAGTRVDLSDYLAGIVVPEGWAKPVVSVEIQNKAIFTGAFEGAIAGGRSFSGLVKEVKQDASDFEQAVAPKRGRNKT